MIFVRRNLRVFIFYFYFSSHFFSFFVRKIYLRVEKTSSQIYVYIFTSEYEIDINKRNEGFFFDFSSELEEIVS